MTTLAGWTEDAVLEAMRAWRDGCGPLVPWFRATPFAAARHYRERDLPIRAPGAVPAALARAAASWGRPEPATLWIFDLPGAMALWLAFALRRRWGLASALCFNGWYDPRGILDGRREIPLLLGLASRLARCRTAAGACLVFDADRQRAPDTADPSARLDNRYALGEEDAPALEQIQAAGWRRVRALTWGAPASDLQPYLDYLERSLPVRVEGDLMAKLDAGSTEGRGRHG